MRPLACIRVLALILAVACVPAGPRPRGAEPGAASIGGGADPGADTVSLVLLGTTDVHGWIHPYDYYAQRPAPHGLGLLAPIADSIRDAHPGRVYLFDSGDLLQGNPLALVYARVERDAQSPIIRAMNLLGYDAAALGNHEFDYGLEHLGRAVAQARFPFISANVFRHGTDEHAYAPYALIPLVAPAGDTLLIGVTGTTTPGVQLWDRAQVEGTLEFRDAVASLRPVVAELRARGADLVVLLSHGGLEGSSYDATALGLPPENDAARAAREVAGIDVIFLGHTHRELADTTIGGALLLQAGNRATSLAAAEVRLARRGRGRWDVVDLDGTLLRPEPGRADVAFLDSLRAAHERTLAYINSALGRLAADAVRWAADAQLALVPASALAADLDAGAADAVAIRRVLPAAGGLVRLHLSGAQLRTALEQALARETSAASLSGAVVWYDAGAPPGRRVLTVRLEDGDVLREDHLYTVAVPADLLAGADALPALAHALARDETGRAPAEALLDYLNSLPQPVRPPRDARFRPAPAAAGPVGGGAARRPDPDPTTSPSRQR